MSYCGRFGLKAGHKTIVISDDFVNDLFSGKIDPSHFLVHGEAAQISKAMEIIEDFQDMLEKAGIFEYH